jgi:hypothetical protein
VHVLQPQQHILHDGGNGDLIKALQQTPTSQAAAEELR